MPDELAKSMMQEQANMAAIRSGMDAKLKDIQDLVQPVSSDFYGVASHSPEPKVQCFDSTAMWSANQLASGYTGFLVPSNDRWASITLGNDEVATLDEQRWLDAVTDIIFREYANPAGRFSASIQECFLDLAAFGTTHLLQEYNLAEQRLQFRGYSTANVWIRESATGTVDVNHRLTQHTTRQLYQLFKEGVLDGIEQVYKDKKSNARTWDVYHIVRPNDDAIVLPKKTPHKYVSIYVLAQTKDTLGIGGYTNYPYHTGREQVISGQLYGQSNAFINLPAIKMLNAMMRSVIVAANKSIDPPLMVPSDGFLVPLSADPGAIWWYDAAAMSPDAVKQFPLQGRADISDSLIGDVRSQIQRGFHVDWLIRDKKRERQTATEIMDDRDEMLRQLAPTLGRIEADMIGPIFRNSYHLLSRAGRLPEPPSTLSKKQLDVQFESPLARAQFGARGTDIQRYMADLTPMLNLWPSMADTIDPDALSVYLARVRNVPAIMLKERQQIEEERAAAAEAEGQNQMMAAAPDMGKTMKDVAQAEAIANGV